MKFPFQWSLFGGHIHFWRVNDGLLVLRVLLRQSWAWHNQTRGRSASDKQQVAPKRTQIPRNKKKQTCQTTSRSDEKTQKKQYKTKKGLFKNCVPQNMCPVLYTYSFYLHIFQCAESKRCGRFKLWCGEIHWSHRAQDADLWGDFRPRDLDVYYLDVLESDAKKGTWRLED